MKGEPGYTLVLLPWLKARTMSTYAARAGVRVGTSRATRRKMPSEASALVLALMIKPIKRMIDKYLGTLTTIFAVLLVGGFVALAYLSDGDDAATDKCSQATLVERA